MRYANHYIIEELLGAMDSGDIRIVRCEFRKYMSRYREDRDLNMVGQKALGCVGEFRDGASDDIKTLLRHMRELRRVESVKHCARIFPHQLNYR